MTNNNNARRKTRHKAHRWARPVLMILCAAVLAAPLSGCVGTAIGVGATAATAAAEERGLAQAAADLGIRTTINTLWLDHSEDMTLALNLDVSEGRVLITGVVPKETMRDDAIRLAKRAKGVRQIIDEIRVVQGDDGTSFVRDGLITTQLRTRITLDNQIQAINYAIETVGGTVYMLGIAQNPAELARVRDHARALPYVRRIVSHVIMKDDADRSNEARRGNAP
ncbi:MAG: BON domain-containing protein [Proteobacteria bacterium]|nr:BON domain-containing protein [Pseudomonadota bacterium]